MMQSVLGNGCPAETKEMAGTTGLKPARLPV